jgi:hypothetical protein
MEARVNDIKHRLFQLCPHADMMKEWLSTINSKLFSEIFTSVKQIGRSDGVGDRSGSATRPFDGTRSSVLVKKPSF